jgi:Fe-S-cluster containining protein
LYCGTCCRNGGPSLHLEDRFLVERGFLHTRHLYTIRRGEPARDPIRGELVRVESEIIKIKGSGGRWACCFLDEEANRCRIYARRPLECRELACWDTSRIEQMYDRGRLSRRDLLAGIEGLWELIEDHERRCSYDQIQNWQKAASGPQAGKARAQLAEAEAYDAELRKRIVARGRIEPAMLDFLLGRPLETILRTIHRAASGGSGRPTSRG